METKISKNEYWHKTYRLFLMLGYIFCLGGIFSFIVMNIALDKALSIDSIYWQRLFVSKVTFILILPGVSLVLISTILLSWKHYGFFSNKWMVIVQLLLLFIAINSINITLLAEKVTAIAIQQKQIMSAIPEYVKMKNREDIFGAVNMFMLLASLIISIYKYRE